MEKITKIVLVSMILGLLTGCKENIKPSEPFSIQSIIFSKTYNGKMNYDCKIDFEHNSYEIENKEGSLGPYNKSGNFSEENESIFVHGIEEKGIYNLKKNYIEPFGSKKNHWQLDINFENGETFSSHGFLIPDDIFSACADCFYDICEDGVLYDLPLYLIYHPSINVEYYTKSNFTTYATSSKKFEEIEGNYSWYNKTIDNKNIFDCCQKNELDLLKNSEDYTPYLSIDFNSYRDYIFGDFSKVTLKNFDYNEDLTNEKLLAEYDSLEKAKDSEDIILEKNKIYLLEIFYPEGMYVQYIFNTVIENEDYIFDKYYLDNGRGAQEIYLNKDGSCIITPLTYLSADGYSSGPMTPQLNGTYFLTEINNQTYIKMSFDTNETLYLKCNGVFLIVDFTLSDIDFVKYEFYEYNSEYERVYVHY